MRRLIVWLLLSACLVILLRPEFVANFRCSLPAKQKILKTESRTFAGGYLGYLFASPLMEKLFFWLWGGVAFQLYCLDTWLTRCRGEHGCGLSRPLSCL
jgi:hypothetical protein